MLTTLDKRFRDRHGDAGPVYDVVLFHDGETWVALIDTSECGKLDEGVRLRPYRSV